LADAVRDRVVECRLIGAGSAGRTDAMCRAAGIDLNQRQVAHGWGSANAR
jgi:endonuclease YncB( thermonuclease family)